MRKFISIIIFKLILLAFFLVPSSYAALQPPIFDAVHNYSGPLVAFWNTGTNDVYASNYHVFFSTKLTDLADANILTGIAQPSVISSDFDGSGPENMYESWDIGMYGPEDGKSYYVRMAAVSGSAYAISPTTRSVTSQTEVLSVSSITTTIDGKNNVYTLDFDSHTIQFVCHLRGALGSPFLPQANVHVDIQHFLPSGETKTGIGGSVKTAVNVTISSSNFVADSDPITWDGTLNRAQWHSFSGHKHNGMYWIIVIPEDNSGFVTAGIETVYFYIDVVHINLDSFIYQPLGENQIHYGPPFQIDYYLSKSAFVTWKIWDRNQSETISDDTLVKVVVSSAPRPGGDWWADLGWDSKNQSEVWDGRNDQGLILSNDIYRYTLDAIEYWGEPGSNFTQAGTDSSQLTGTITYDVLRIVDLSSTGISDEEALAHIKYTLAGANSQMGGANIKIVICSPGTTFYMSASSGNTAYLSGAATYYYLAGDPMVYNASNIKKVFTFDRIAGVQDETWNGLDESGTALTNDNYVFAISATDDSDNHAIDNSGNDRIIIGNITIDRTAAQEAGDSDAPSVTSVSVSGTTVSSGTVLNQPFTTIAVVLSDSGGSGVDLTNTSVSLTNPSGTSVTPSSTANDSVNTITLTFSQQSTNGTYSLKITPTDKVGNSASEVTYSFSLSITQAGVEEAFKLSVKAYPNPAKGVNSVTFAYTVNSATVMKLEIFNLLGELIYDESWSETTSGDKTKTWSIVNKSNTKIATGVYLYRISDENAGTTTETLKKLVVVQ